MRPSKIAHFALVRALPRVAAVLACMSLLACDGLDSFELAEGEAYCGQIALGGGYRQGLSPRVQMKMSFDVARWHSGDSPGHLTTHDAGAEPGRRRLLEEAPLRVIAALNHDPLSQLEFGDGRERNMMFALTPSGGAAESLLAVVSLRTDETVEVRLLRPGRQAPASGDIAPEHAPIFGLFVLRRQEGDCGI